MIDAGYVRYCIAKECSESEFELFYMHAVNFNVHLNYSQKIDVEHALSPCVLDISGVRDCEDYLYAEDEEDIVEDEETLVGDVNADAVDTANAGGAVGNVGNVGDAIGGAVGGAGFANPATRTVISRIKGGRRR